MSIALALIATVLAVCAQGTVAPLFPLGIAVPNLVLLTLVLCAAFMGSRATMLAVPVAAILETFLTDRTMLVLFLSYVPLVPVAMWLEVGAPFDLPAFLRLGSVLIAGAVWTRALAGATIFVLGADFAPGTLVFDIIMPGLVIDTVAFMVCYGGARMLRLRPQSLVFDGAAA